MLFLSSSGYSCCHGFLSFLLCSLGCTAPGFSDRISLQTSDLIFLPLTKDTIPTCIIPKSLVLGIGFPCKAGFPSEVIISRRPSLHRQRRSYSVLRDIDFTRTSDILSTSSYFRVILIPHEKRKFILNPCVERKV